MSKKVNIILLEDIPSVGQAGDIVSVLEGYARNMLIPQMKAALATAQNESAVQDKKLRAAKISQADLAARQAQAESLMGSELLITARLKDGDEIYGQIKPAQIVKSLNQQANLSLTARAIGLPAPITVIGTYDVTVKLSPDVETVIKVTVVPDPASHPSPAADED